MTAIDTTVPHSARIWNYWLGGTDNYTVDREAGDAYKEVFPGIAVVARTSRAFLTRAVRYLAGEAGMRQFLDIGTGLPTANNTHQVAQSVAPESRIVYVDNDPLVLAHAQALLSSSPEGSMRGPGPGRAGRGTAGAVAAGYRSPGHGAGRDLLLLRSRAQAVAAYEGHHSPKPGGAALALMPEF